jgi:hypothetical protein
MVKSYYQLGSVEQTRELFPSHSRPDRKTISRLVSKFETYGSVLDLPRSGRKKDVDTPDVETKILESVIKGPTSSIRERASELDLSKSELKRILSNMDFHAYRPSLLEKLTGAQKDARLTACDAFRQKADSDKSFLQNLWFSDECRFSLDRVVNKQNCVFYALENPHYSIPVSHTKKSTHVWCALSTHGIIGPYFFREFVTSKSYTEMLLSYFLPETVKFHSEINFFFQQDGAPAHTAKTTKELLDQLLPEQWIGLGGPLSWPPRSPDLTPPDFFLWGYVKSKVYMDDPSTVEDLEENITSAIEAILAEMCKKTVFSVPKRMGQCISSLGETVHGR